jgi:hypothetical protein
MTNEQIICSSLNFPVKTAAEAAIIIAKGAPEGACFCDYETPRFYCRVNGSWKHFSL